MNIMKMIDIYAVLHKIVKDILIIGILDIEDKRNHEFSTPYP